MALGGSGRVARGADEGAGVFERDGLAELVVGRAVVGHELGDLAPPGGLAPVGVGGPRRAPLLVVQARAREDQVVPDTTLSPSSSRSSASAANSSTVRHCA